MAEEWRFYFSNIKRNDNKPWFIKIKLTSEKVAFDDLKKWENVLHENNISLAETNYFIFKGKKKSSL
jgi:secreted Zn-dependent insulinase-like peptidase